MAVLISGIVIFVVMAIIAVVSWIVGTLRNAEGQPIICKIAIVVAVICVIVTAVCYFFDDSIA